MPSSKILVHWIGQDLMEQTPRPTEDELAAEYARRLKDDYKNGLFTTRKKEKDVLPGIAIASLVRICFTEIRPSQAQTHAARFGALGIGFRRQFISGKGRGPPYSLCTIRNRRGLLEQSIKTVWKKSKGNNDIQKPFRWIMAFCKPMSNGEPEDSVNYIDHYEEMEWRVVFGESLDPGGVWTNPRRGEHRLPFKPTDVELMKNLGSVLHSGSLQTTAQLFPELNGSSSTVHDPQVVSAVWLPDGRSYQFRYNSYGEVRRVELPTGGAFEYDYAAGLVGGYSSGVFYTPLFGSAQIYRRTTEKRAYKEGGVLETKTTFTRTDSQHSNDTTVTADSLSSGGVLLARSKHYFHGNPAKSFDVQALEYAQWKHGREYKMGAFDANGTTVLRRVEHTWQQPIAGSTWPLTQSETNDFVKANNPQITQTLTTLEPATGNQVSKQTFTYDQYCNRTDQWEYDFSVGGPTSYARRRKQTTYLTTNPVNWLDYASPNPTASSIHIRSTAAELLLRVGVLTGVIGSSHVANAQEKAKDLISESLTLFQSQRDKTKLAEARIELALCYWRTGEYNEALDRVKDALALLTIDSDVRQRLASLGGHCRAKQKPSQ